jgi:hypothetical protein
VDLPYITEFEKFFLIAGCFMWYIAGLQMGYADLGSFHPDHDCSDLCISQKVYQVKKDFRYEPKDSKLYKREGQGSGSQTSSSHWSKFKR